MSEGLVSLTLWYEALGQPLGVVVETNDVENCRQKLYALRREANDRDLDSLGIVISPDKPGQIWIVKKQVKVDG